MLAESGGLAPEELPDYLSLKSCKVIDYTPEWKQREEGAKAVPAPETPSEPPPSPDTKEKEPPPEKAPPQSAPQPEATPIYDCLDMKPDAAGGLGMVEITAVRDSGDEDDLPPGR